MDIYDMIRECAFEVQHASKQVQKSYGNDAGSFVNRELKHAKEDIDMAQAVIDWVEKQEGTKEVVPDIAYTSEITAKVGNEIPDAEIREYILSKTRRINAWLNANWNCDCGCPRYTEGYCDCSCDVPGHHVFDSHSDELTPQS